MNRCPDCGGFYDGLECPTEHTDDLADRQVVPQPVIAPPRASDLYQQGDWVSYVVTIGAERNVEEVHVPAVVLGVSSDVVRLACYVTDAGRVVYVDAPLDDVLPPVNPLEGDTDGD